MQNTTYPFRKKIFIKYLALILVSVSTGLFFLVESHQRETVKTINKKDNSTEIKRLTNIADDFYSFNDLDSAFIYYNKILPLCNLKKNTEDYVYAIYSISYIYNDKGDFISSEATAILALPYLKDLKKTRHAWIVYTLLGSNYSNMYDFNNAMIYYKKSKALKTSIWRKGLAINNIASIYMNQKKYLEAIELLKILLSPEFKPENDEGYGYAADNLGYCYYSLGDSKKALYYFYKGLKFRLQPNKGAGLENSYIHLSTFFEKTNMQLAKEYAKKAYDRSVETGNSSNQVNSLAQLIKTSEGTDLKKYSLKYIKSSDSLINARKKAKNQFANIKYNFNIDKTENLQFKNEKLESELHLERQKKRNIISYIIIFFTTSISLFLYFHLKIKSRRDKNEATYISEMRISKKLHDELANHVHQTVTFAKNTDLEQVENKDQLLNNLDKIYSTTRNISKENSNIATDEKYITELKEMISEFNTSNTNLLLSGIDAISWYEVEKNKKIAVYRVLQELLANMKKQNNVSLVFINFKTLDKHISINYTDDGKNMDLNNVPSKNKLQNIENRILAIKGKIQIESNFTMGFKVSIKFPL